MNYSPLTLSFAIVGAGLVAGLIPFFVSWNHRTAHRWIAFGAGTILGAAFLHMIPEAYEIAGVGTFPMILVGFLSLYIIEQSALRHPHEEDAGEFHEVGLLALIGLAIHDLVDGIALGSGQHLPQVTPVIFIALILHKIPTMFAMSVLLLHGDYKRSRVILFLTVLLLCIPAGTLLSGFIVEAMGENHHRTVGMLINFSAGTFIYIGAYELLPEMHRKSPKGTKIGLFFILGLALMFLLTLLHPVF